jgi:hypothetical protein
MRMWAIIASMTLAVSSGVTARDGEWRSLFDGKTTAGWRGFRQQGMPPGWQVVDGALTRVGPGGDIITTDRFESFELSLEWKIAPGANSGVFFRVIEEVDIIWHAAPEIQVIDNAYPQPLQPAQTAGSNYDLHPPALDATRSPGSWNEMRLIVKGNHVEHWLNGHKVVEYEIGSADWERRVKASKFKEYPAYGRAQKGHIGLQDHGDWVAYRNIRIRPL